MENKLYNMDCVEFLKTNNTKFDLIIADPPANQIVKDKWDKQWKTEDDYVEWLSNAVIEFEKSLSQNGQLYLYQWIGEKNPLTFAKVILKIAEKSNFHFKNLITWRKDRGYGTQRNYMYVREEILWFVKNPKEYIFNPQYGNIKRNYIRKCGKSYYKRAGNVWVEIENDEFPASVIWDDINENSYETIQGQEYSLDRKAPEYHSTRKPIALSERIIKASSNENDLVYIPFAGSGSEIQGCIKNNRKWIATEINEVYCNNIKHLK